jgi:TonB family protein
MPGMISTRPRARPAAPLISSVAGSTVLHAALLLVAMAIPAGIVAAREMPEEPSVPFAVALVAAPEAMAPIVVSAEPVGREAVPPPPPERIEPPEWTVEAPHCADRACQPAPDAPDAERGAPCVDWKRMTKLASLVPGHGAGGGLGPGALGSGVLGVGGRGAPGGGGGGGAGGGLGGPNAGTGSGDGGDGAGSGWARGGGETRGPQVAAPLEAPPYPQRARQRGWEGLVVLELTIDEQGRVTAVVVAESSGREALDDAAREAAAAWTVSPALSDGRPVAGTLRVPVRFELTD